MIHSVALGIWLKAISLAWLTIRIAESLFGSLQGPFSAAKR